MRHKFIRRNWDKHKRLGKNRKKRQIWRRPKGRHNKIRKYRMGYPVRPSIGMRKNKKLRCTVQGLKPIIIRRFDDLKKAGKTNIIILANIGKKKKEEILKEAEKMNLRILKNEISKKDLWRKSR